MQKLIDYVMANGGFVPTALMLLGLVNMLLSTIQKICNSLKIAENPALQQIGSVVGSIVAWLSANVPSQPVKADSAKQDVK